MAGVLTAGLVTAIGAAPIIVLSGARADAIAGYIPSQPLGTASLVTEGALAEDERQAIEARANVALFWFRYPAITTDATGNDVPAHVRTSTWDCITEQEHVQSCVDSARDGVLQDEIAIVDSVPDLEVWLGRPASPDELEAFKTGDGLIRSTGDADTVRVEIVPAAAYVKTTGDRATSLSIEPVTVRTEQMYQRMPTLVLSNEAAERLGLVIGAEATSRYLARPIQGETVDQELLLGAFPETAPRVLEATVETGPTWLPLIENLSRALLFGAIAVVAVLISLLVASWTMDGERDLQTLRTLGLRIGECRLIAIRRSLFPVLLAVLVGTAMAWVLGYAFSEYAGGSVDGAHGEWALPAVLAIMATVVIAAALTPTREIPQAWEEGN